MSIADRPVLVVRYEDMLGRPVRAFGTISQFLGLKPNELQLSAAIGKSSFEVLAAQEREKGFSEKPKVAQRFFRAGKAG